MEGQQVLSTPAGRFPTGVYQETNVVHLQHRGLGIFGSGMITREKLANKLFLKNRFHDLWSFHVFQFLGKLLELPAHGVCPA